MRKLKDIIVFGKGWYFEKKKTELQKEYRIIAILDNAANRFGDSDEEDIPVYLPRDVLKLPKVQIVIMSIVHFIDMWKQLIEEGVDEGRIEFGVAYQPCYDSAEENLNRLNGSVISLNHKLSISCSEGNFLFNNLQEYKKIMNQLSGNFLSVEMIQKLPVIPYSRRFGEERGTPVDRYYIENFIRENSEKICGNVMEIGDSVYTNKFGKSVNKSYVLHKLGMGENVIKGDLASEEGIGDEFLDCFICTQTVQMIYETENAVRNIYRSLNKNGIALVTMHGISQLSMADYCRWGEYWRFTKKSVELLFQKYFDKIQIFSYGNVKTVTAHLYGLCQEDLAEENYEYNDEQYPLIVAVVAQKE